jgi:hypothetical protein
METYIPQNTILPYTLLDIPSAWRGLESYIKPLMDELSIPYGNDRVFTEFGVEYGYSCIAFANYFGWVNAVDTFQGDEHAGVRDTKQAFLGNIPDNFKLKIMLYEQSYQYFFKAYRKASSRPKSDLVHIDIVHTYEDTYACGDLAWQWLEPNAMLFHDTLSFPDVARACEYLAKKYDLRFLNIPYHYGLGILKK